MAHYVCIVVFCARASATINPFRNNLAASANTLYWGPMITAINKGVKETLLWSYYGMRSFWPLWYSVLNRDAHERFEKNKPTLNAVEARIAKDLSEQGIAIARLDELFPNEPGLLAELQAYAKQLREVAEHNPKKTFILQHWEYFPAILLDNKFVALSLRPTFYNIVNTYMGMWTKFFYFMLGLTLPMQEGEGARNSQRWHRDPEDKKMVKVFLYLNDVDETAGPFTYIPKSHYGGKYRRLFPQRPPRGYYPPDGALEQVIGQDEMKVCTGKAGTFIFADTSGLHKGGYASHNERLMYTAGYISGASPAELRYSCDETFLNAMKSHSPEVRYSIRCTPTLE